MLDAGQKPTLLLSMLPYLSLAMYDSWLHERARRVPMAEQLFHGMLFLSFLTLIAGLFLDHPRWVLPAVIVFGFAVLGDEIGFHGTLARRERRLHFAAYTCFAGFIAVAIWMGAFS
jgi:hypothetical protein